VEWEKKKKSSSFLETRRKDGQKNLEDRRAKKKKEKDAEKGTPGKAQERTRAQQRMMPMGGKNLQGTSVKRQVRAKKRRVARGQKKEGAMLSAFDVNVKERRS